MPARNCPRGSINCVRSMPLAIPLTRVPNAQRQPRPCPQRRPQTSCPSQSPAGIHHSKTVESCGHRKSRASDQRRIPVESRSLDYSEFDDDRSCFCRTKTLSDRQPTLSVVSKTNEQTIETLRRSQRRVPVRWSALVRPMVRLYIQSIQKHSCPLKSRPHRPEMRSDAHRDSSTIHEKQRLRGAEEIDLSRHEQVGQLPH